ncbi:MAG TPA: sensor domain-containing diguanylate cyclase, partial [Candidatus Eremiobacteraeota bacterium]|nr:sensor domain-containing diguanylate cyclase [Candidatus Eremiobacteraeota bacterium]
KNTAGAYTTSFSLVVFLLPIIEIAEYLSEIRFSLMGATLIGLVILSTSNLKAQGKELIIEIILQVCNIVILFIVCYLLTLAILQRQKQHRQIISLISLVEAGQELGSSLTLEKIVQLVVNMVKNLVNCNTCVIYLRERGKEGDMVVVKNCFTLPQHERLFKDFSLDVGESIVAEVIKKKGSILLNDAHKFQKEKIIPKMKYVRSVMVVPCLFQKDAIGSIYVGQQGIASFRDDDLRLLSILANQAALAIKNAQLHENVAQLAITDSLSGLYTHGYFQESLDQEFKKAFKNNKPLSVMILDIDFFKIVNDNFGHPQGDALLKQVGGLIKSVTRDNDIICRYGGDEFTVTCINTNRTEAILIAERIRQAVEEYDFIAGNKVVKVTISGGVASYPEDCDAKKDLVVIADETLYEAKKGGRNRIAHRT